MHIETWTDFWVMKEKTPSSSDPENFAALVVRGLGIPQHH